jgi:hypothetical protein
MDVIAMMNCVRRLPHVEKGHDEDYFRVLVGVRDNWENNKCIFGCRRP